MGTSARVLTGVAATLAASGACWVIFLTRMDSLAPVTLAAVMMGGMMLPSALPLVAGQSARPAGTVLVVTIYLAVWTAAGVPMLLLARLLPTATLTMVVMALAVAVGYSLTPLRRACRERCVALCRESAAPARVGIAYGVNCLGCSAGVMAALFVIGPMNPLWMLLATGAVAIYKMPVRRIIA